MITDNRNATAVIKPYASSEWDWNANGIKTDTTDLVAKTAPTTPNLYNYVTGIQVQNNSTTVATDLVIKDGSTVLWKINLPLATTTLAPVTMIDFPTPLQTVGAVNVACLTTGSNTYINIQGYQI